MSSSSATVSVILTAYRRTEFLRGAIESILGQTQLPLEVLVTDDSAEPAIRSIVASFGADGLLRYRSNPAPLGAAGSVRAALAECRGSLVAVLNDDDLWEPTLLERLTEPLGRHPEVAMAFCDHWIMDETGAIDLDGSQRFSERYGRSTLKEGALEHPAEVAVLHRSVPAAICALFRREVVPAEEIPVEVRGAYDFWLSVLAASKGRPFYYVAARLARYRLHPTMESRRPSSSGSEGHRVALGEIWRRGWFPHLRQPLQRSWAGVNCDCGLERLAHGEGAGARALFATSLRHRLTLRALAGLAFALVPGLGRRGLVRLRSRAAG